MSFSRDYFYSIVLSNFCKQRLVEKAQYKWIIIIIIIIIVTIIIIPLSIML